MGKILFLYIFSHPIIHQNGTGIRYLYHFRRYCECFCKIISTFVPKYKYNAKYITQKS